MMGLDPAGLQQRHAEALEAIIALLEHDEPIDRQTDWFTLRRARLQLRPYSQPRFEIVVSSLASPTGPTLAGRFGLGLLSLGALPTAGGDQWARTAWSIAEQTAAQHGRTVDRSAWRIVGPRMHLAESEAQARREVAFGIRDAASFVAAAGGKTPVSDDVDAIVEAMNASGAAIIGTPERAIAHIEQLVETSGGFGCYLIPTQEWADREASRRSFELFARYVIPHFSGQTASLQRAAADFVAVVSQRPNPAIHARAVQTG
jgi:limonene 1,2-monooxygenase